MSELPFVEVEHTADWSLRVRAKNMQGLLTNTAVGMFQLMGIERKENKLNELQLDIRAEDREELLVSWLEELLFHIETREVAFDLKQISFSVRPYRLRAALSEYPIAKIEKEIKAVTYHGLKIIDSDLGVEATIVFDV